MLTQRFSQMINGLPQIRENSISISVNHFPKGSNMQLYAIICNNIQFCENIDFLFEAKSYYIYARVPARSCVFRKI